MKLACMGDSITNGHGLHINECWTTILQQKLDCTIVNYGVSGDTTAGMIGRFQHMLLTEKPTHVMIMGGSNDLSFDIPYNHILSNIKTMTRQARHLNIPYIIGVPTTYYPVDKEKSFGVVSSEYLELLTGFQKYLLEFIAYDECLYLDFSYGFNKEHFLEDGIHPNAIGQKLMADRAIELLQRLDAQS